MPAIMVERSSPSRAAVGITVKSGWAAAVLVAGEPGDVRIADSRRIELSDPDVPESRQPYHEGFGTARAGGDTLTRLLASVRRYGSRSVARLLRDYGAGRRLAGLGMVVGSLIEPERIANDHIRIHALEGRLFRTVIEEAAGRHHIPSTIWREKELYAAAAALLGRPEPIVRQAVTRLGRDVEGSWRAEQKAAATAAWMVLEATTGSRRPSAGSRVRATKER
jgi:hypothetical protein